MKTKKGSRVLALLLSLVMLLGSLPTAFAEGKDPIVSTGEYDDLVDLAVVDLYNKLIASESWEVLLEVAPQMTRDEIVVFLDRIVREELIPDDPQMVVYDEHIIALFEDYMIRSVLPAAVECRNAAPLLPPVTGGAVRAYSLRSYAVQPVDGTGTTTTAGIEMDKDVVWDAATQTGKIRLELYSTGNKVTTETRTYNPADIILVLDLSGSMNDSISSGYELFTGTPQKGSEYDFWNRPTYYVRVNDQYLSVQYCFTCGKFTNGCNHWGGPNVVGTEYKQNDPYPYYTAQTITKQKALQNAVNAFVASIEDKATGTDKESTEDDVAYRIGIVRFSNSNDTAAYVGSNKVTNYGTALMDVSTASGRADAEAAAAAATKETTSGTRIDRGIEEANKIFDANPIEAGTTRNRVVVVFTDGEPSDYGGSLSTETVANNAVENAYTAKNTHEATVYTIGILSGANGKVPVTSNSGLANRMLHFISNNFKTIPSYNSNYEDYESYPADYPESSYYLTTETSEGLDEIFDSIASGINTSGGSSSTLTESSVVTDVVTPYFTVDGNVGDIIVSVAQYTAENTFSDAVQIYPNRDTAKEATITFAPVLDTDDDANGTIETSEKLDLTPTLSEYSVAEGQTIRVDGFDFSARWCGTEKTQDADGNVSTVYRGQKLIIEIPFTTAPGFLGGNEVDTNGSASGVHYVDGEGNAQIIPFPENVANIEVEKLLPTIEDDHIYLSNAADIIRLMGTFGETNANGTSGQFEYCLLEEYDSDNDGVKDAFRPITDASGNVIYYSIDGVRNEYVTIRYSFFDEKNELVATYTIPAGGITGELVIAEGKNLVLTDDTGYSVTCTVTPTITEPTKQEYADRTYYTKQDSADDSTVYVYKPELTFKDSSVTYLDTLTLPGYYAENNLVTKDPTDNSVAPVWKNGTTVAGDQMSGDEPEVTLAYTVSADDIISNGLVVEKDYIPVKVTVTIDGDQEGTADQIVGTSDTTFHHNGCDEPECKWDEVGDDDGNPAFLIHVKKGDLKITKTVEDETFNSDKRVFTFTVAPAADASADMIAQFNAWKDLSGNSATVTIEVTGTAAKSDSNYITLKDLPIGSYTVTETDAAPYLKYYNDVAAVTKTVAAGQTVEAAFTNTADLIPLTVTKKWVDADASIRPKKITINVLVDGEEVYDQMFDVEVTEQMYTFDRQFAKYDSDGKVIDYTFTEDPVANYEGKVEGNTITNTILTTSLTITKKAAEGTVIGSDESFLFTVTSEQTKKVWNVVITGEGSVTLDGLLVGDKITVEEDGNWSWRYKTTTYEDSDSGDGADNSDGKVTLKMSGNSVKVTNTKTNNQWLTDESKTENRFNQTNN